MAREGKWPVRLQLLLEVRLRLVLNNSPYDKDGENKVRTCEQQKGRGCASEFLHIPGRILAERRWQVAANPRRHYGRRRERGVA